MRSLCFSLFSVLLTAGVITYAYYQKKQFYPSVVYITKSNPSMAVIYVQFFVIVLMLGKLFRKIFLGTLRAAEFEHFMERFWYALTETCLAFTVFRDDFNPRFVALFTVLLFLKSFHWLAEERVDYMERSPIIGWLFHVRAASLLSCLGILDYMMIMHAYNLTITKGPTVQLVFGFEYAILITMVANTTIKYVLHAAEMRADSPWENKAVFLLYTELVIGLIRVILYLLFVVIMARIYTLPMFVFRPMFYTMRNFKKALNDVIMSRRAIRNMNTLYPDATPEELSLSDYICIICREDMVSNSKKLPCGHIFHTACLRSWFQRQQTCPTCRLNILRAPSTTTSTPRPDIANAQNQRQNNNPPNQPPLAGFNNNNNNNNNNNSAPNENPFANLLSQNFTNSMGFSVNNAVPLTSATPLVLPPFPFMAPYSVPPPPIPPSLDTLSDDELRALEGNERRHVEERIKLLRNIQLLLDASASLMNQYSMVSARINPVPIVPSSSSSTVLNSSQPEAKAKTDSNDVVTLEENKETEQEKPKTLINDDDKSIDDNKKIEPDVHIEDLGSDEYVDLMSSSSSNIDPKPSTSKDLNDHSDSDELSELRRRRLQKFTQKEESETVTE